MTPSNTEVEKVDPLKVPAFVDSAALGKGHEDQTEARDFIIPRAKLIQYTAEEVTAQDPADRIEPGKLVNSITKKELPLLFIPIYRYKTYSQFNAMDKHLPNFDPAYEPGEMIFSTTDKTDKRIVSYHADGTLEYDNLAFGKEGQAPKVTETFNYLCLFPGESLPLILSFKRTSIRAAKEMNTMLQIAGGNMFDNKFRLAISRHEEGQKKWFTVGVRGAGKSSADETRIADSIFEHFRGKGANLAQVVESSASGQSE